MAYKDPEDRKAYVNAHREEIKAQRAAYGATHCEHIKAYSTAYYSTHREDIKAKSNAYHAAHREQARASAAAYRRAHPDVTREASRQRRAQKAGAKINDLSAVQRREILQAYGYRCVYCNKKFPANKLAIDHLTPIAAQGDNTLHNVTVACKPCNSKKYTGPVLCPVQPLLLTIAPAKKR